MIDAAPNLKIVANYGAGYDNIDYSYAEKGIAVTNTPKVSTEATAELTFALLLAAARRILKVIRYVVQLDLTDGHRYFS